MLDVDTGLEQITLELGKRSLGIGYKVETPIVDNISSLRT